MARAPGLRVGEPRGAIRLRRVPAREKPRAVRARAAIFAPHRRPRAEPPPERTHVAAPRSLRAGHRHALPSRRRALLSLLRRRGGRRIRRRVFGIGGKARAAPRRLESNRGVSVPSPRRRASLGQGAHPRRAVFQRATRGRVRRGDARGRRRALRRVQDGGCAGGDTRGNRRRHGVCQLRPRRALDARRGADPPKHTRVGGSAAVGSAAADVLAEARGDASRRGARPRRARTREGESRVVRGVTARAQDGVRAGTVSSLLARPGRERRRTRIQGKRQTSERPRGWSWPWRRRRRRRRRKRRRRRRRKRRRRRRRKRRRRRRRRRRKRLRRRRRPRPRPRLRRVRGDASSRGRDREPRRVRARTRTLRRRRRRSSSTSTRLGHELGPTSRLGVVRARVFGGCVGVVHARRDIRDVRGCRGGVRERRLAGVPRPGGAPDGVETFRLAETPRASLEDGGGVLRRRGSVSVPGDDGWTPDVDGRESAPAGAESAPTGAESAPAVAPAETAAAEAPVLPAAVAPAETVETPETAVGAARAAPPAVAAAAVRRTFGRVPPRIDPRIEPRVAASSPGGRTRSDDVGDGPRSRDAMVGVGAEVERAPPRVFFRVFPRRVAISHGRRARRRRGGARSNRRARRRRRTIEARRRLGCFVRIRVGRGRAASRRDFVSRRRDFARHRDAKSAHPAVSDRPRSRRERLRAARLARERDVHVPRVGAIRRDSIRSRSRSRRRVRRGRVHPRRASRRLPRARALSPATARRRPRPPRRTLQVPQILQHLRHRRRVGEPGARRRRVGRRVRADLARVRRVAHPRRRGMDVGDENRARVRRGSTRRRSDHLRGVLRGSRAVGIARTRGRGGDGARGARGGARRRRGETREVARDATRTVSRRDAGTGGAEAPRRGGASAGGETLEGGARARKSRGTERRGNRRGDSRVGGGEHGGRGSDGDGDGGSSRHLARLRGSDGDGDGGSSRRLARLLRARGPENELLRGRGFRARASNHGASRDVDLRSEFDARSGVWRAASFRAVARRARVFPVLLPLLPRLRRRLFPGDSGVPHLARVLRAHRLAETGADVLARHARVQRGVPRRRVLRLRALRGGMRRLVNLPRRRRSRGWISRRRVRGILPQILRRHLRRVRRRPPPQIRSVTTRRGRVRSRRRRRRETR